MITICRGCAAAVTAFTLLTACSSNPSDAAKHPTPSRSASPTSAAGRELSFQSGSDTLPATFLSAVRPVGTVPGALIISGSGQADRDGDVPTFPHLDTNLNFANALSTAGVASLRYDKVGSGKAGLGTHVGGRGIDFDLHAREALDAYRTLAHQPGIDPRRLIVVGHSEGALFALWLADRLKGTPEEPRALVLAAPLGVRYLDLLARQIGDQYRAARASGRLTDQQLTAYLADLQRAITSVRTTGSVPTDLTAPGLATTFTPVNAVFLRQADRQDPAVLARSLGPMPALVLRGTKDVQVSAQDVQHLMSGFSADPAGVETDIPNADHLFKVVTGTPNPAIDYPDATRPFAPQVAPRLTDFLHTALG